MARDSAGGWTLLPDNQDDTTTADGIALVFMVWGFVLFCFVFVDAIAGR